MCTATWLQFEKMISPKWRRNSENVTISEMPTKWQQMCQCRQDVDDCLKIRYRELVATRILDQL